MSIKLCLSGASGRMGRAIIGLISEFPDLELVSALESPSSAVIGQNISIDGQSPRLQFTSDYDEAVSQADVVIDFSTPNFTDALLACCQKYKRPILIATTGHFEDQLKNIAKVASEIPVLLASNTSLGVFVLNELTLLASKYLGSSFESEIIEIHHHHKKDAPSGTALTLARNLAAQINGEIVLDRSSLVAPRQNNQIGVQSLRGGDIVGEHTVYFFGAGERIEITHRCTDRKVFARGALVLAAKICELPPGFYNPSDIFKI